MSMTNLNKIVYLNTKAERLMCKKLKYKNFPLHIKNLYLAYFYSIFINYYK